MVTRNNTLGKYVQISMPLSSKGRIQRFQRCHRSSILRSATNYTEKLVRFQYDGHEIASNGGEQDGDMRRSQFAVSATSPTLIKSQ